MGAQENSHIYSNQVNVRSRKSYIQNGKKIHESFAYPCPSTSGQSQSGGGSSPFSNTPPPHLKLKGTEQILLAMF